LAQDWKDHKLFCKAISLKVTMPVSHPPKMTNQLDSVAKTPVSELTGHARACVRMQDELRKLFPVHGQMFADWWHDKTTQQKIDTLLDVSNNHLRGGLPYLSHKNVTCQIFMVLGHRSLFHVTMSHFFL
jgi:hypothetical protein